MDVIMRQHARYNHSNTEPLTCQEQPAGVSGATSGWVNVTSDILNPMCVTVMCCWFKVRTLSVSPQLVPRTVKKHTCIAGLNSVLF